MRSILLFAVLGGILFGSLQAQTTIQTDTILPLSTCPGGNIIVPFTVANPAFGSGNRFYAEWSDGFGNFDTPDTIGSSVFLLGNNGFIFASIPEDAGFGLFYRVRVVSSNPEIVGGESPNTAPVFALPFLANIVSLPLEPLCPGEEVTLVAGIGIGATYEWSTGDTTGTITVTEPGSYTVTASFLGCDNESEPYQLEMLPRPVTPTVTVQPDKWLMSTPATSYQWFYAGNAIPGANAQTYRPLQTGSYNVQVTNDEGCQSLLSTPLYFLMAIGNTGSHTQHDTAGVVDSDPFTYPSPVQPNPNLAVRIYPVPTSDLLYIETYLLEEEKLFFILYDAQGKVVVRSEKEIVKGPYQRVVNMGNLPSGPYFMYLYVHGRLRSHAVLKVD